MQQFKTVIILVLAVVFNACTSKNTSDNTSANTRLEFASPEEVGLSTDSLKMIDEMIMRYVDKGSFPGAVVLIAKDGKIVYETEVGWSDSLHQQPYTKENLFRMASMTKPYTSVATMQLYEKGLLDLNDPVSKYIPEFGDPKVLTDFFKEDSTWTSRPANREPTIANLLSHTAGVPYSFMNPPVFGAMLSKYQIPDLATPRNILLKDKMAQLGQLPLAHDPGEKWMYGLNTDVLGRVVEVASGMNLQDYIRENITAPLGSNSMDFFFDESIGNRIVIAYTQAQDSTISYIPTEDSNAMYNPNYPFQGAKTYFSGGSGMTGTARDYYKFCQMMLNDGNYNGHTIIQPATAQSMHENQIDTISYPWGNFKFGYGFDVAKDHPVRPDGTYSWAGAFKTMFWIDPQNDMVAIMLSQVIFSSERGMSQEFEKIVYSSLK